LSAVSNNRTIDMTRLRNYLGLLQIAAATQLIFVGAVIGKEPVPTNEAAKLLPDTIQSLRASGPASGLVIDGVFKRPVADANGVVVAIRTYTDANGKSFSIEVAHADRDSSAYAMLTQLAGAKQQIDVGNVGTASIDYRDGLLFYKGANLVQIESTGSGVQDQIVNLAQAFAATLPVGDDDIPVLVKHLPIGSTSTHPTYFVSLNALKSFLNNQPVLDALNFEGGTEAVVANYGQSQLVIVEFTTPQFSIDNDSKIWTKIAELKSQGQPTPSAYRRVGNYSVFVFNAPDERAANALIDQVKYEKVVQWLGDDPHLYERLQRYFTQTSAGVLVAVLKSSGLSLLLCLAAGALIGTMLFRHRRAQRAASYSDAGGSIRLNLDQLTEPANTHRLLKSGSSSDQRSSNS
jgi:hypothetical protein